MMWRKNPLKECRSWVRELRRHLALPIMDSDVEGLTEWVYDNPYSSVLHEGVDFIKYLGVDGNLHNGLEPDTPIRAISDGRVHEICPEGCVGFMTIRHNNSGLASGYCHLNPDVRKRQRVRKGEIIGRLAQDPNGVVPVHLHFDLGNCDRAKPHTKYGHDIRYKYLVDLVRCPEHILPIDMTKRPVTTPKAD